MKKILSYLKIIIILLITLYPNIANAKRGCCSWHGGVAGCSENGRQICNDGTLSPTCTCTPVVRTVYGCTDPNANNYNANANKDNGSCTYDVYGCTDSEAKNYNSEANIDDDSCEYYVYGCTDSKAINYNSEAEKDDDSCKYKMVVEQKATKDTIKDEESEESIELFKNIDDSNDVAVPLLIGTSVTSGVVGIILGAIFGIKK